MTRTTTHLSKVFDMLWTVCMGLFLGLTAGMVVAVILTFKGARKMQAVPDALPYSDPRFAAHHSEAVAGAIGQDLFVIGGTIALVLLGLAMLARLAGGFVLWTRIDSSEGSKKASALRWLALVFCILCMIKGASLTADMNAAWPGLYELSATDAQLDQRRVDFDDMHQLSERIVGAAWLGALLALAITPWCQRPADVPLQSGDGKKEDQSEKAGQA
jgi:hypothetical protein